MKKRKLLIALAALIVIAAALALILPHGKPAVQRGNLLQNGDFALLDANGLPQGWYTDAYVQTVGFSEYSAGEGVASITNYGLNDARFAQTVSVQPDSLYCLSGFIRAEATGGLGANLSIADVYVFSPSVYDSEGEWQQVRLYGRTGEKQREVTVFARLGGYSGEATGTASFRDLSLEQIESVPAEYIAYQWYKSENKTAAAEEEGEAKPAWPWLTAIACLYGLACFALRNQVLTGESTHKRRADGFAVAAMLCLAAAARCVIALLIPGYGVDIGCFTAWGNTMARVGPGEFYSAAGFCDYPPGYMLVLGLLGLIGKALGTGMTAFLVKVPSIACDIAAAAVLYGFAKKRVPQKAAFALAALYAFNPLTFAAGAAWGQADSVMALCILLVVTLAIENRWAFALPVYMLAVLMKPQALMFGPLGLLALVYALVTKREKKLNVQAAIGLAAAAAVAAAVVLPFSPNMDNSEGWWLVRLYSGTMSYYANITVNACNYYFLLGKNWIGVETLADWPVRLGAMGLLLGGALLVGLRRGWYKRGKARAAALGACALAILTVTVLPMQYQQLGTAVIVLSVLTCAALYVAGRDIRHLPLLGAAQLILLCSVGTMMHERYLFAAVALLALACVLERDWRVYLLFALLTICVFLNVGVVLDRGIRIGGPAGHLEAPAFSIHSDSAALEYIVSGLSCLIALLSAATAADICVEGVRLRSESRARATAQEAIAEEAPFFAAEAELKQPQSVQPMRWLDWLLMLGLTAIYAVAALVNLGSTASPQTWWRSTAAEDSVVLDLGQIRAMNMLYLGGIHSRDSDFIVRVSDDGLNWSEPYWAQMREGQCFKWQYVCDAYDYDGGTNYTNNPRVMTGRYVRIEAQNIATTLYEVILRDPATQEVYSVSVASGNGALLIDGSTEEGSCWRSALPNESVTLDLGQVRAMHMQYYLRSLNGDKTVAVRVSEDGKTWSEPYWTQSAEGDAFKWQYVTKTSVNGQSMQFGRVPEVLSGRYVRLEAQSVGTAIYEVILRDPATQEEYPVTVLDNAAGRTLIDEQDTFTGEPGWYNSTYFDEIYHARTGYEHYLAMQGDYTYRPYETSHPPLGKVLIAFAIRIFGMTPFGWRFAGALAGILMLPGMYLLGKLLTRRRLLAFAAMFLMAVDCMHFTQTRIATIDSFVVLFIIWSMVFMVYYIRMDYWNKKLWQTLAPLFLSGLCMGLAVASKWTGCYAGVGLALLFFWSVYRRFRESLAARETLRAHPDNARFAAAAQGMYRRPLITIACCLIFFVAVPALIYYASYIPYFLPSGGVSLKRIIQAAEGMLSYHSTPGLGMDHPFYSPWYQWPLIGKPMWYYSSTYRPDGATQTIVAMGNPAVWWGGLAALVLVLLVWAARHVSRRGGLRLHTRQNDMRPAILLIAFAAQYVPWTLVPRGTYIYHYFPSVPFIILCVTLCLDWLCDAMEKPLAIPRGEHPDLVISWQKWPLILTCAYLAAALALFIAFFPYASGVTASFRWLRAMQWFNGWIYY